MYSALFQEFNNVRDSGMLHDVRNAGNQLKIGDNKYPHTGFRNVLQYTELIKYTSSAVTVY